MNINKKSRVTSLILTLLLGPLGLLYSSVFGGIVLLLIAILSAPTLIGPFVCWFLAIIIGDSATHKHNKGVERFEQLMQGRQV
jgi:ABC-type transport system involved in multi-copper enzyme maturation permease subunit